MNNHRYLLFFMVPIFTSVACAMEQQAVKATSSPKSILKKTAGQSPETTKKNVSMLAEKLIPKNEPAKAKSGPFDQVNKGFDESIACLFGLMKQVEMQKKSYQELLTEYEKACAHRDHLLDLSNALSKNLTKKMDENMKLRKTINQMQKKLNSAKAPQNFSIKSEVKKENTCDGYCSE